MLGGRGQRGKNWDNCNNIIKDNLKKNFSTFSSKDCIILTSTFRSLISEIHLWTWYYDKINFIFLHIVSFANSIYYTTDLECQLYINFQSIYESVLELSMLLHWSICPCTNMTLYYYGFVVCLTICQGMLPHFLFFSKAGSL